MGGEEFMLIVERTTATAALAAAADLVAAWRRTAPLVTVSAGVALHPSKQSPTVTYGHADAAFYAAKVTVATALPLTA